MGCPFMTRFPGIATAICWKSLPSQVWRKHAHKAGTNTALRNRGWRVRVEGGSRLQSARNRGTEALGHKQLDSANKSTEAEP